jgi:hypothetical protein
MRGELLGAGQGHFSVRLSHFEGGTEKEGHQRSIQPASKRGAIWNSHSTRSKHEAHGTAECRGAAVREGCLTVDRSSDECGTAGGAAKR